MNEVKVIFAGDTFPVANNIDLFVEGRTEGIFSKKVSEFTAEGILLEVIFGENNFDIKKHLVRRTETGCEYDEKQDFSAFKERSCRRGKRSIYIQSVSLSSLRHFL